VAQDFAPWHFVCVDSDDKNGGPNNLRAWRVHKKLSQAELAARVKPPTNANMIQYLESGERGLSLKWLRRLADALETTPGHLADHAPEDVDAELLDFWSRKMDHDQRRQLRRIAEALTKTGTDGK
jgi:transcriptional regulator with XRE-family HTH domain